MRIIVSVYKKFLEFYGTQGWWPLSGLKESISEKDKDWPNYEKFAGEKACIEDFKENWPRHLGFSPKNDREIFEIITGTILTQNTSWNNVERVLYNLNKHNLNSLDKMNIIDTVELALLIKSAGYHNQKSDRLKGLSLYFSTKYKNLSDCFKHPLKNLRKELLALKGIGPETADSIILYAGELPIFVIDAYTKRIFSRILGYYEKHDYDFWQDLFMKQLDGEKNKVEVFKGYHGLIVKHGKEFCKTVPLCEGCFLKVLCHIYLHNVDCKKYNL
ncbi:MAG: hypothetical protein ABRQ38_31320 [Candidatus Eremiobacterota bacterium]